MHYLFQDILSFQVYPLEENKTLYISKNGMNFMVEYHETYVAIIAPKTYIHSNKRKYSTEDMYPAIGFKTDFEEIAVLPAEKNAWDENHTNRLKQLIGFLEQHQKYANTFITLVRQSLGMITKNIVSLERITTNQNTQALAIFQNDMEIIPFGEELYQMAENVFIVHDGYLQSILDGEETRNILPLPMTAHETLIFEKKLKEMLENPPSP